MFGSVWLVSHPVHGNHRQAVGNGVATLDCYPSVALALLLVGRVAAFVANGGGEYKQIGALQGHEAGAFGEPLVPTYLYADFA